MTDIKTLVLETRLFEDAEMLQEAVGQIFQTVSIRLHPDKMDDADWDRLLGKILAANVIITI